MNVKQTYNFCKLFDAQNFDQISYIWGLSTLDANVTGQYLYYVMKTFVNDTLVNQVVAKGNLLGF